MDICNTLGEDEIAESMAAYKSNFQSVIEHFRYNSSDENSLKLSVYNDCIHIDNYWTFQCVSRWLGYQSRSQVYLYLDRKLYEIARFLERVAYTLEHGEPNDKMRTQTRSIIEFIGDLKNTFGRIRQIYPQYDELILLLDNSSKVLDIYFVLMKRLV